MNEQLKDRINELKAEIDALRPLDKDTEARIQQKFRLDWNYHSNNIEGNSLTFGETKTFLLHGITADGKPLKDHLDIKGHNDAILLLEDVIKDNRDLSENFIRELHQIILNEPYDKLAITSEGKKTSRRINIGQYKNSPNHVITATGETFFFARPEETQAEMGDLLKWYNETIQSKKLHPVELAALLHYRFVKIHPFDDGNGRISRILMNLTLMKFGFPPVIIKTQKKDEYYRALQQADGGDTDFFVDYIARLQIDSLELYLRGAKGERIEEEDDIDKEITLFKARILNNKKETTRSNDILSIRFNDSFDPFLKDLNAKLEKLNDLFAENRILLETDNQTTAPATFENLLLRFKEKCNVDSSLRYATFHFQFNNLKQANNFNRLNLKVTFEFLPDNYNIEVSLNFHLNSDKIFLYETPISTEDKNTLINNAVKALMQSIENIVNS